MRKLVFTFFLGGFFAIPSAFAEDINHLKVQPSTDEKTLFITWEPLGTEVTAYTSGYALQWSKYRSDIGSEKTARQYLSNNQNSLEIRAGGFTRNQDYYFRIYSFTKEGRSRHLSNGSKLLKWNWSNSGEIETSEETIVEQDTSSETQALEALEEFGKIRAQALDTFADFSWSRPRKLTKSDYDGYHVLIASKSDMTDPIAILEVERSNFKGRVKGLSPQTQYHAQGYFYKYKNGEKVRFGKGLKKTFKTFALIDRTKNTRASRNIKKIERKNYVTVQVGDTTTSSSSSNTSNNEDSSNNSSDSNTSASSSSSASNSTAPSNYSSPSLDKANSKEEIKDHINHLQKEIKRLQTELKAWQKKLRKRVGPNNNSTRKSSATSSSRYTRNSKSRRSSRSSRSGSTKKSYVDTRSWLRSRGR